MERRRLRLRLHSVIIGLTAVLAVGCAAPASWLNNNVSDELAWETDCGLELQESPCDFANSDFVIWEDGLTEDEAAVLGLWNNPDYQELLVDLQIANADLIQAGQLTNPDIITMFPVGVKQWEFVLMVPLDVVLLRPCRVAVAELETQRVGERLVQDGLNVIRDVRIAYVDLLLAQQQLQLAEEGLRLRTDLARIAQARLEAGAVAELDVSAMRLEAVFSKEEVIRFSHEVDLARERLRYLLGAALAEMRPEAIETPVTIPLELDAECLVQEAIASRPDLRAVEYAHAAACQRARLARYDYLNVWGALPDINSNGRKGLEAGPGVRFALPIFNQNQGAIARAVAEAERLGRQYARLQDTVALEVRLARTQLLRSQEQLAIWRAEAVPQAEAAVTSARKALEEDGVSLLLVMETTRQWLNARQLELEAEAGLRRSVAELERSVGRGIFESQAAIGVAEEVVVSEP